MSYWRRNRLAELLGQSLPKDRGEIWLAVNGLKQVAPGDLTDTVRITGVALQASYCRKQQDPEAQMTRQLYPLPR